jgi:hypothetical protein
LSQRLRSSSRQVLLEERRDQQCGFGSSSGSGMDRINCCYTADLLRNLQRGFGSGSGSIIKRVPVSIFFKLPGWRWLGRRPPDGAGEGGSSIGLQHACEVILVESLFLGVWIHKDTLRCAAGRRGLRDRGSVRGTGLVRDRGLVRGVMRPAPRLRQLRGRG